MIPITNTELFEWTDPDDEITYCFRPKTGAIENKMLRIQNRYFNEVYRSKVRELQNVLKKYKNDNDDLSPEDEDKTQVLRFEILTSDSEFHAEIVDLFLADWKGEMAPEFPKTGKPSDCFTKEDNRRLANIAMDQNKLTIEEKKSL